MTTPRVLVIGDVILDRDVVGPVHRVAPDAPVPVVEVQREDLRPGGAGLAARLLATSAEVELATAVGDDGPGRRLVDLLGAAGVAVRPLTDTGVTRRITRVRSAGQSLVRLDDAAPRLAHDAPLDVDLLAEAVRRSDAVLVADYGNGLTTHPRVRDVLVRRLGRRPLVWDPHPRGGAPLPGATLVTPNRSETLGFARSLGLDGSDGSDGSYRDGLASAATALLRHWRVRAVAATDGEHGVLTALADSPPLFTPTPRVCTADPCGAGDRFAGAAALALARGAVVTEAVGEAVEDVAAWLDRGGVAGLAGDGAGTAARTGAQARSAGGGRADGHAARPTVVATGGCFDVLHAGHVACLQAARRLGDRLVVLLNSDASVRRLKGPTRPVNPEGDRLRVLEGLECVDEVVVFDDDTPVRALDALRPDVWAKGGDYSDVNLPEADLVRSWGGRVVLLPYLPGRSTTSILDHSKEIPA